MKYEIKFNGILVDCIDVEPNNEARFNFPFKLIIPKNIGDNPSLIYVCNLPKDYTAKSDSFDEILELTKKDMGTIDPVHKYLSLDLGNPMIVPFVPRFKNFRPNFLGRDCFLNTFEVTANDEIYAKYLYLYENLADQHKAMIEYAINLLKEENINVDDKAIISGYSEGAKFASHLTLLHPESFKAVIGGGTGGTISMPVAEVDGYKFNYPTGIADYPDFDFENYKNISFFYYMADKDKSDSAVPYFEDHYFIGDDGKEHLLIDECGNKTPYVDADGKQHFILDENGNYTSKFGLFSDEEVNAINKALGTITQERFKKQEKIFEELGLNATFKLYPGNHRTIFDNSEQLFRDIEIFIEECNKNFYINKQ